MTEGFFRRLYRLIRVVYELSRAHPRWARFVTSICLVPTVWFASTHLSPVSALAEKSAVLGGLTAGAFGTSVGFVATLVTLDFFLPVTAHIPHVFAVRGLGLEEISSREGAGRDLIRHYASQQPAGQQIRVICLSGLGLFQEQNSPLRDLALDGKLHALMPICNPEHPVLKRRYSEHSELFRKQNFPDGLDSLVKEVEHGKEFLRKRGNIVSEHNAVCVWRVVLFAKQCIVQPYFPNVEGSRSYGAPVFVFRKMHGSTHCYYETYSVLFDLLCAASAAPVSSQPPPLPPRAERPGSQVSA